MLNTLYSSFNRNVNTKYEKNEKNLYFLRFYWKKKSKGISKGELTFKFDNNMPDGLPAIIIGKIVHINPKVPYQEAITYLAEEIGHHKTLADGIDITDQSVLFNRKLELKGREWGYRKLVPKEKLMEYLSKRDTVFPYELADEFNLPVKYINEVVDHYRIKGII